MLCSFYVASKKMLHVASDVVRSRSAYYQLEFFIYMNRLSVSIGRRAVLLLSALALVPAISLAQTTLTCMPSSTNVQLGQSITFTASGGNGTYNWGTPDSSISGAMTSIVYTPTQTGAGAVVVRSGTQSAACDYTVTGTSTGTPTSPGLPNTGAGGANLPFIAFSLSLLISTIVGYSIVRTSASKS